MDLKNLKVKLRESIRQTEDLVRWYINHGNQKDALDQAARVTKFRELLRILDGNKDGEGQ